MAVTASTTAKVATPATGKRKASAGRLRLVFVLTVAGSAFMSVGITILLIVGMFPTMAAWFSERDNQKTTGRTIGACNLAGLVIPIRDMLPHGQNLQEAGAIIQNPFTWLLILGSSAIGWVVLFAVPFAVRFSISGSLLRKKEEIRRKQEALVKEWGTKVTLVKDMDKEQKK